MRRVLSLSMGLLVMLVVCKPAAKPVATPAVKDTASVAVKPGDVCPPDTTPVVPDTAKVKPSPRLPDSAKKAVTPAPKPETTAAKPAGSANLPKPTALPRLWDFGSDKCIPCKMMKPILDDLTKEYAGKVEVKILNVYEDQKLSGQYRIQVIPTQVFIDPAGKEVYRHVGFFPRDSILMKFREYGFIPK